MSHRMMASVSRTETLPLGGARQPLCREPFEQ